MDPERGSVGVLTTHKPISSFDVIEGSPHKRDYTKTQVKFGKSDRNLITETNFFSAADAKAAEGRHMTLESHKQMTTTRVRNNFPNIMQKLMEQTQGSFSKDGPQRYIEDFFKEDIISSPKYRQDEAQAKRLMQMRLDSRGSPIRRTFLGNLD